MMRPAAPSPFAIADMNPRAAVSTRRVWTAVIDRREHVAGAERHQHDPGIGAAAGMNAIFAPTPRATINAVFAFCPEMRPHSPRHPGFVTLTGVRPGCVVLAWR
jgi:hypothetical protein